MWNAPRILFLLALGALMARAQDKPRVFITDSTSWEMAGASGGSSSGFGGAIRGGARPQTAEIVKTFGERCPDIVTNNLQEKSDYVVVLDHEGGKGFLRHRNKVAVFNRVTGDSVVSKSTLSLGGSVQVACDAIKGNWREHGSSVKTGDPKLAGDAKTPPELQKPVALKISVVSTPDGADIEIDGSFVGSTPSAVEVTSGEQAVAVKKAGYKTWERKLKITGGDIKVSAELERLDARSQ